MIRSALPPIYLTLIYGPCISGGYRASGDALRSHSACRNAVTPARRRCCCVGLLEAVWPTGPGTRAGAGRAGSAAREFPDEGALQADVGGRGGIGDELCRGALHGRFGGPDAWLKALPDYQLGLVKCVDTGQNAAVSYPHSADVGKSHDWALHLSGADEQGPRDAVVVPVDRTKILWLLRLNGDPLATKSSTTRQYERPGTAGSSSRRHRRARTRGPAPAQRRINRTQALRSVPATRFATGRARLGLHPVLPSPAQREAERCHDQHKLTQHMSGR